VDMGESTTSTNMERSPTLCNSASRVAAGGRSLIAPAALSGVGA
jgi:hypothetical protein